jgi:hypothetical protein
MRCVIKYVLCIVPLALCTLVALYYAFLAEREAHVVTEVYELTPQSSRNIATIFVFAGVGFTLIWFAFCLFHDWRAWDDRRRLRKALNREEHDRCR